MLCVALRLGLPLIPSRRRPLMQPWIAATVIEIVSVVAKGACVSLQAHQCDNAKWKNEFFAEPRAEVCVMVNCAFMSKYNTPPQNRTVWLCFAKPRPRLFVISIRQSTSRLITAGRPAGRLFVDRVIRWSTPTSTRHEYWAVRFSPQKLPASNTQLLAALSFLWPTLFSAGCSSRSYNRETIRK